MDSYLTTQRPTIFQQVGVLIYVFDVESREPGKDMEYYRDCLEGLRYYSPDAAIFLLLHKMDLVRDPQQVLEKKRQELEEASGDATVSVFGTTIFDQTLYKVCSLSLTDSSTFSDPTDIRPGQVSSTPSSRTPVSSQNTFQFSLKLAVQPKSSSSSAQPS